MRIQEVASMSKREMIKSMVDVLNDKYVDLVWSFITGLIGGGVEHGK